MKAGEWERLWLPLAECLESVDYRVESGPNLNVSARAHPSSSGSG